MPRSRTLRRKTSPRPWPPARRAGQATEAETRLLALARELAELPADATLADVVGRLGGAHGPDAPLPRALAQAWLRGRNDKTAALALAWAREQVRLALEERDRKSTRLNSSHQIISYAVFCLKKKKDKKKTHRSF